MTEGLILAIKYGLKRAGWWYFQMAIPARLQPVYGCALLKEALGTKNDLEAAQMISGLAARYKKEMELIETGQLKAPKALDQAAKALLKKWGLAAHSVHNDQTLEEVFTQTLYDKDDKGEEISAAELRAAQLLTYLPPRPKTDILLSEMPECYLRDHPNPTKELEGELERTTRYLIDSIGSDIRYLDLSRDQMNGFRDSLLEKGNVTSTVKKRIGHLQAMFTGCSQELEINKPNPAEGIRIRNLGKDTKKRIPFTDQQLEDIKLKLDLSKEIDLSIRLMLETTGRLNEIIGLEKADIYLKAPIPYVAIRGNANRTLKTKTSTRNVPLVNPETLAALNEYLESDTSRSKNLFPSWATNSDGAGKCVSTLFRKIGIDATAHYTRHTVAAQLRKSGCSDSVRCAIGGWTTNEGASEGYGETEFLDIKATALKKALGIA